MVLADVILAEVPSWVPNLLTVVLMVLSLFMILLVLIQRGKGGGLAGAFGGAGGSSAFGSRAGDTFTRITVVVAAIWILLIMIMVKVVHPAVPTEKGVPTDVIPQQPVGGDEAPD